MDNLSLRHIPDLLESPNISSRSKDKSPDKFNENCDSITDLPSTSLQLQHLVKSRPKRAKTRAATKPVLTEIPSSQVLGEGLDGFFPQQRPGSVTPTTLTPLVSPTSEECSSLSFVDSPTISREDNVGNVGRFSNVTSGETTPIMDERKMKIDRNSPLLKNVTNWTPRSLSSDNLEKISPLANRKSPLTKDNREISTNNSLNPPVRESNNLKSPSNESIKNIFESKQHGNGILKTPISMQKPRPWSVLGHESKHDFGNDSSKTTPDDIDDGESI